MKWEYTVSAVKTTEDAYFHNVLDGQEVCDKLNELGKEGWEFVSAVGIINARKQTEEVALLFKRPWED